MISSISADFKDSLKAEEAVNKVKSRLMWIYSASIRTQNPDSSAKQLSGFTSAVGHDDLITQRNCTVYIVAEKSCNDDICSILSKMGGTNIKAAK